MSSLLSTRASGRSKDGLCFRFESLRRLTRHFNCCFLALGLTTVGPWMMAQDDGSLRIAPFGETVELELTTPSEGEYILESQAQLMQGEEWAPLMQFRGNATQSRRFVDPICGNADAKFFRLRRLLAAPRPEVNNFRLLDLQGEAHELYYQWDAKAIVLLLVGDKSDLVSAWATELAALQATYGSDSLRTWTILMSDHAQRQSLLDALPDQADTVPVLQDTTHAVSRTLSSGGEVPEALLIDPRNWSVVYRGPVSLSGEAFGDEAEAWSPLAEALAELMAGGETKVARLRSYGEESGLEPLAPVGYTEHIVPLIKTHCFPCHTPGNIAPWAMDSYERLQEFSSLIKSAVLAGEMPPWHADPKYSVFSNAKSMSNEEVAMLVNWIDQGLPREDGPDPLAEDAMPEPIDWPLGTPDAVINIPPQEVPAEGVVDYIYLFAESPFPGDVWLKAATVKPGDRSVVHHCLVFKGTFTELLALRGGLAGFFAGYVPGMEPAEFPEGTGKRLKKSDIIVIQMHYTVSGKATTDATQLGLYLADAPPEKELITTAAYDTSFRIPPRTRDVYVQAKRQFNKASTLYEFSPHMHYRGQRAKYTLQYPDGSEEVILSVPAYFFDWQALYRLDAPKKVPAGTTLLCEGWFDNTAQNRFNPDPNDTVRFGEQSWEEMFIGYFDYTED